MKEWLYENAAQHAKSSWWLIKECASKTASKRENCVWWADSQKYSLQINKEKYHKVWSKFQAATLS